MGASRDLELPQVPERSDIADFDGNRLAGGLGGDEERWEDTGVQRQLHRRFGLGLPGQRVGPKRPLERCEEIERRIGDRPGGGKIERLGCADQHRRMRVGRLALVGELERGGPGGGNQRAVGRRVAARCGFYRKQRWRLADRQRPAVAQRVDRLCSAARGGRFARARGQSTNSVTSGTWSDGCSQSRVCSTTR